MSRNKATSRVSVLRAKGCFDTARKPTLSSKCALNKYSKLSPPFHITGEDVDIEFDNEVCPLEDFQTSIGEGVAEKCHGSLLYPLGRN